MDSFIKKVFNSKVDDKVHAQFVRFGKGEYKGRAAATLVKTTKVKLKGSFEYSCDFVELATELGHEFEVEGILLSKEDLSKDFSSNNIHAVMTTKKGGLYYEFEVEKQKISADKLRHLTSKSYAALLDVNCTGIELKIKKKLPKPGKSGDLKIDDGFCIMEADLSHYAKMKEAFFWDVGDFKKGKSRHEYQITDLVMPQNEKDFEKIRILTKRKGKIIRKLDIDGREEIKERELLV